MSSMGTTAWPFSRSSSASRGACRLTMITCSPLRRGVSISVRMRTHLAAEAWAGVEMLCSQPAPSPLRGAPPLARVVWPR